MDTVFQIVGGGPAGFSAALLLAKEGYRSVVYEGRNEIPDIIEESYPIGINPRALKTMELINPELEQKAKETGRIVDSWQIYGGSQRFAKMDSGVVFGTSRGKINILLYEEALKSTLIEVKFNHKLEEIDFENKQLIFSNREQDGQKKLVKIQADKVLAADGVNSMVRRQMQKKCKDFQSNVVVWKTEFRPIFAKPGETTQDLDLNVHYIFNGQYTATIKNGDLDQWSCVVGIRDDDDEKTKQILLSKNASPENVQFLKKYIESKAPLIAPLLQNEKELQNYFSRRSFRSAIVKTNRINEQEWICLLGDSAHSMIPPVGEGLNSALEDSMILWECIKQSPQTAFTDMNQRRLADMHSLYDYAVFLNEQPFFSGEKVSRGIFMAMNGLFYKTTINDMLFGPKGLSRTPYNQIIKIWKDQKKVMLNSLRIFTYIFAIPIEFIISPYTITKLILNYGNKNKVDQTTIKSPVGDN